MMRVRLRATLGPRAAGRLRLLPEQGPVAEGVRFWDGVLRIPMGPEPGNRAEARRRAERAGALAAAALPEGMPRAVLDARALAPEEAVAITAGLALRAPAGFRLDLWHGDAEALAPLWDAEWSVLQGVMLARELVAMPGNALTPKVFAHRLKRLEAHGVAVQILRRGAMKRAGFGGLLAVGQGSANPPRLVVLRWAGRIPAAPVVFVGKGITFDSGGVSLKRGAMHEMREDMAGAAACAGAMLALALRDSPAPAAAVLALAENAIGAAACRPGDVVSTLAGYTVEVVDTDAEGRLALADALNYAVRAFRPEVVIDLATLTGAAIAALGHQRAALYGNDPVLAAALCAAGEAVGERLWPLPVTEADRRALDSDVADLRQCSPERGQPDGSHAAAFLREFLGGEPLGWAHLDMAGMVGEAAKGKDAPLSIPGGFGVRLLCTLVGARFEDPHRL
ncbi:leucyl aminopeptidase family protein [Pseudoroseomonas globiformis]|uniref:Leucyl aminopeptidase family protein n=1 Tax=Teichococcus globiformis TaxID=2307229 RepID=A0ABV7G7M9_9PROT